MSIYTDNPACARRGYVPGETGMECWISRVSLSRQSATPLCAVDVHALPNWVTCLNQTHLQPNVGER